MNILLPGTNIKVDEAMINQEQSGRYKVIHNVPDLTKEEREKVQKEILLKLYNLFKNEDADLNIDENTGSKRKSRTIDTKTR